MIQRKKYHSKTEKKSYFTMEHIIIVKSWHFVAGTKQICNILNMIEIFCPIHYNLIKI